MQKNLSSTLKRRFKWMLVAGMAPLWLCAQPAGGEEEGPKGKATVQVFSNFHTGFGTANNDRGFELERSYLGYEYDFGKGLSVRGVMNVGQSSDVDDYHRIAYIKYAQVSWKKDRWTLNGGLIPTALFNLQERFWGYRYVAKSFQDEYKFGSSADLGLSVAYRLANWVSADAIVVNGEGYRKIQVKDGLNYGLGLTFTPLQGLTLRLYGGLNESSEPDGKNIVNVASFAGYDNGKFRAGVEYNYLRNSGFTKDEGQSGLSAYAAVKVARWANLFARYDDQFSKGDWNRDREESAALLGAEFKLGKYVKLSPNFRMSCPKASGAETVCYGYVNCYFGL